jgi:hypothetical protein
MTTQKVSPVGRVRVISPLKARRIDTGDDTWFPQGTVLWHVEIGEENTRFEEIGGRGRYECPTDEFTPSIKKLSR